jgi:hypothetical protein
MGVTAVALVLGAAHCTMAFANSAWWHVESVARPTNLNAHSNSFETQEVVVNDTGHEFILSEPVATEHEEFFKEGNEEFAILPDSATASEVQAGLEKFYGAGNVEVTGGPEEGKSTYHITFVGALAYQLLRPVSTALSELVGTSPSLLTVNVTPPRLGQIIATASNLGDKAAEGIVSIADKLPPGLKAVKIEGIAGETDGPQALGPVSCSLETLTCTFTGTVPAFDQIEVRIGVIVEGASSGALNEVQVSGGGAPFASTRRPVTISDAPTPFAVESYELAAEEEGGAPATQAGSHPFQLTTSFAMNSIEAHTGPQPAADPKDLSFNLPPGLLGNTTPFAQCTSAQFETRISGVDNECPQDTVIGVAKITVNEPIATHFITFTVPVFNLAPEQGEPARFGILLSFTPVVIDTAVRTGGDYGVTATVSNISQAAGVLLNELTIWGTPGDPRHDAQRGWGCLDVERGKAPTVPCSGQGQSEPPPFLSLPTSCTGPLSSSVVADSWPDPEAKLTFDANEPMTGVDGCNRVPFEPSISLTPEGSSGSSPSGAVVRVHEPQQQILNPVGLVPANVKNTTVALPEGVSLNPSAADGLAACSLESAALSSADPSSCPEASKVGTVEVKSPLLPNPLKGGAYVAAQNANPFGSLVALYVVVEDPISGTRVKLAGNVHLSESGQIVSTFEGTPQLPFEDFTLSFFGGPRAALALPAACGPYTTTASFDPWSGGSSATSNSTFNITSGPAGAPCAKPQPFTPSIAAGATTPRAGGFTTLTTSVNRADGQQPLRRVKFQFPSGLSGVLSGVALCGEAEANAGTCSAASLIGETTVSAGVGNDPYTVRGGKVYLTGPYHGAPFGLSITTPAKAGPYDLGEGACDCIVVRAAIEVDRQTAALTVATDETGPFAIPTALKGIPLYLKHVNVAVTRPGFTFNPTNCSTLSIAGDLLGSEGADERLTVPFGASNCANLKFEPKFTVSTSAKASRLNGTSLSVALTYPKGSFGTQANISRVKVVLPKQLPSRLTTLHQACLAATFAQDPGKCPAGSVVGHAKVLTPVLPVPLEGSAYFVSHGGEAFPSLTMLLKGYGVTIELVGATLIRNGITSTTFKTTPDVPFSSFDLTLPAGKYSALSAVGNLCAENLVMPTEFIAQNGAAQYQQTKIAVTGCKKHHKKTSHKKKHRHAKARKAKG